MWIAAIWCLKPLNPYPMTCQAKGSQARTAGVAYDRVNPVPLARGGYDQGSLFTPAKAPTRRRLALEALGVIPARLP